MHNFRIVLVVIDIASFLLTFVNIYHMYQQRKNGATALSLATDYTCRDILTHHKAICASVTEDPTKLIAAALAFCATHTDSEEPGPSSALSPRAHHFNPAFLWAPPAARAAVVAWAQLVFIDQFAATIQPFEDLPDDCAGDVLEFFGMTYKESERIAKHCSSPEARAWVRAVVAAAIVVGAMNCVPNTSVHSVCSLLHLMFFPFVFSTLVLPLVTQAKATAELVPAAREGDLATVQDCLSMKANIEIKHVRCRFTRDLVMGIVLRVIVFTSRESSR